MKRNFGNQNHIRAAGHAGVNRNPAGVTAHDFEHHHAVVAFGGGVQAVERVGRTGHGGIETEGDRGRGKIVVNRLGHADNRDAGLVHLLRDGQRTIAANGHQRGNAQRFHAGLRRLHQFLGELARFAVAGLGGKLAAIGRAENGATAHEQAVERLVIQHAIALRRQQTVVAAKDAEGFPAALGGGFGDGADHGVQAGTVAATGDDANFHFGLLSAEYRIS